MINYVVEKAVRAALSDAMGAQYNSAVKEIAQDIINRCNMPFLYNEDEIKCYRAGAVVALMWMVDDKTGYQIEHDIELMISNIESGVID